MNRGVRLVVYRSVALRAAADGCKVIASEQIGAKSLTNATQVRRDLSGLGSLGTRGVGYRPEVLVAAIDSELNGFLIPVLVGVKDQHDLLGRVIADYAVPS